MKNLIAIPAILGLFAVMQFFPGNAALAFAVGVVAALPMVFFSLTRLRDPKSSTPSRDNAMVVKLLNFLALAMVLFAGWTAFKLRGESNPTMISVYGNVIGTMLVFGAGLFLQARKFAA